MLSCWQTDPDTRPLFNELEQSFRRLLHANVAEHYIQLNEPYLKANVENSQCGKTDYIALMGSPHSRTPSTPTIEDHGINENNQQSEEI